MDEAEMALLLNELNALARKPDMSPAEFAQMRDRANEFGGRLAHLRPALMEWHGTPTWILRINEPDVRAEGDNE